MQKILSRNVILIPLCAIFSVLSAITIFASTLSDHYELISYDVGYLRDQVELENNRTMAEFNQHTGLNMTIAGFLTAVRTRSFDPQPESSGVNATHRRRLPSVHDGHDLTVTNPYKNDLNERRMGMIREILQATFVYEVSENLRDYYVVHRINYPSSSASPDIFNSSVKTNILYETYSGIWKLCNYLSSEIL